MDIPQTAIWRKSTFSNANNNCVEVAMFPDGGAAVRHSKQHSTTVRFSKGEWEAFVRGVNDGQFDAAPK